jgi:ribonuclease D
MITNIKKFFANIYCFLCRMKHSKSMTNKDNYIDSQDKLDYLVARMENVKIIAIDTEFIREKTYFPILSTIQIAFKNKKQIEVYIIDCLLDLNLSKFIDIIYDRKITKICHSSIQDLQIFKIQKEKYHKNSKINQEKPPQNIIDTQVMANMLYNINNISYKLLLEELFNIKINKEQQRSDWKKRPLNQEQISYIINDVKYLIPAYEKLMKKIIAKNRFEWLTEEMSAILNIAYNNNIENIFRRICPKKINHQEKFRLWSLLQWREEIAQYIDIPRNHLIEDDFLIKIINSFTKINKELKEINNEEYSNQSNNHNINYEEIFGQYLSKNFIEIVVKRLINNIPQKKLINLLENNPNKQEFIANKIEIKTDLKNNLNQFFVNKITEILNKNPKNEDNLLIKNIEIINLNNQQKKILQDLQKIVAKIAEQNNINPHFLINNNSLKSFILQPENSNKIFGEWRYKLLNDKLSQIINV